MDTVEAKPMTSSRTATGERPAPTGRFFSVPEGRSLVHYASGRFFFDKSRLLALAKKKAEQYLNAEPYPHIVFDNFLPDAILNRILEQFPDTDSRLWRRFHDADHVKSLSKGDYLLSPDTRHLLAQFRTAEFLEFLEILTGRVGLVANPHVGGAHEVNPGGKLALHTDATWDDRLELFTGINLFIYLNKDWNPEWGGNLELWDENLQQCRKSIAPIFNRVLIFGPNSRSYHGHPHPLTCPPGFSRKAIVSNYSMSNPPDGNGTVRQGALYRQQPGQRMRITPKSIARASTPPFVYEALRRLKGRVRTR